MEDVVSEPEDIIDDIEDALDSKSIKVPRDTIKTTIQEILLQQIDIADKSRKEVNEFAGAFASNERIDTDTCPFLSEIYYGDAYDKEGIDGLLELCKELNSIKETATANGIRKRVFTELMKKNERKKGKH